MRSVYLMMMSTVLAMLWFGGTASANMLPTGWHIGDESDAGFLVKAATVPYSVELGLRARSGSTVLPLSGDTYTASAGVTGDNLALWNFEASVFLPTTASFQWVNGFAVLDEAGSDTDDTFWNHAAYLYCDDIKLIDFQQEARDGGYDDLHKIVGMQLSDNLVGLLTGFDPYALADYDFSLKIHSLVTHHLEMTVSVVPVPASVLLGVLGLSYAGVKLRKRV